MKHYIRYSLTILSAISSIQLATGVAKIKEETQKPALMPKNKKGKSEIQVSEWQKIEEQSKNTVAQVFSQKVQFNWVDPYRAPTPIQSSGTAFFIDKTGHLLTNYHVVEGAVSVQLAIPALGKQLLETHVIGSCPELDISLLKLDATSIDLVRKQLGDISFLKFGDSDILYPTEPVLALGYPLGFRSLKSTVGVVAGREVFENFAYVHITAPLNPGNSGGPALNKEGKVIGINSAIIENAQNMGYVIPINNVKTILSHLHAMPLVHTSTLGVRFNATTKEHAQAQGNPWPAGVHVFKVIKNSVADKAGIQAGDMIYKIDGHIVDAYGDVTIPEFVSEKISLSEFLMRLEPNAQVELEFYRKGKKLTCLCVFDPHIVLPIRTIYPEYESKETKYEMIGGMCIMPLKLNHFEFLPARHTLQKYAHYENRYKDVLVITRILPGSCAHKTNCLYEGAILDTINTIPVKTIEDFTKALQESVKTGYISIQTKDKYATVLSLDKILLDEKRLARDFMFDITDAVKQLEKAKAKQNNQR